MRWDTAEPSLQLKFRLFTTEAIYDATGEVSRSRTFDQPRSGCIIVQEENYLASVKLVTPKVGFLPHKSDVWNLHRNSAANRQATRYRRYPQAVRSEQLVPLLLRLGFHKRHQ